MKNQEIINKIMKRYELNDFTTKDFLSEECQWVDIRRILEEALNLKEQIQEKNRYKRLLNILRRKDRWYSYSQIAKIMNKSESTIRYHIARLRKIYPNQLFEKYSGKLTIKKFKFTGALK